MPRGGMHGTSPDNDMPYQYGIGRRIGGVMAYPHGVVSGQCNDCLAEQLAKEAKILADMRDRWQHGMMTKEEAEEAEKQKED
jgi:hypothetical protein